MDDHEAAVNRGRHREGETPPARPSPGRGARSWLRLLGQLIRYGLFGSLGALTDFLVYSMLIGWLGVAVLVANVFGVLSGITVSFLLNSRLTFVQTDHRALRALRFLTVGLTGMGLSTLLLAGLTGVAGLDRIWAKAITLPLIAVCQFGLNKSWTFRPEPRPNRLERIALHPAR